MGCERNRVDGDGDEEEGGTILGRAQFFPSPTPPRPLTSVFLQPPWPAFKMCYSPVPGHKPFPQTLPHRQQFSNQNCTKSQGERRRWGRKINMKISEKQIQTPENQWCSPRTGVWSYNNTSTSTCELIFPIKLESRAHPKGSATIQGEPMLICRLLLSYLNC